MADLLYFVGSFALGGTERHLSQILPALVNRGWSVEVVTLNAGGVFLEEIRAAGINTSVLARGFTVPIPKVRGVFALINQTLALRKLLQNKSHHLLHCFLPSCCEVGGLAAKLAGFSPIVMSRRSQAIRPSLFPGDKAFERWALKNADAVFGHSNVVIHELAEEGIDDNKLFLNHNGLDIENFDRQSYAKDNSTVFDGRESKKIVFAVAANLIPYKGHKELLLAAAQNKNHNQAWQLMLIGSGNEAYQNNLKQLVSDLDLTENVKFLGARNDIPKLLCKVDIGILPSHQEGFSNAILEYMAAKLPVIASATGGNFDAVENNKTGFLFPVKNQDLLASKMRAFLDNPELIKKFGIAGRKRVEAEFSLSACVDRYEKVYQKILSHSDKLD